MSNKPSIRSEKRLGWQIAVWAIIAFPTLCILLLVLVIVQAFRGSCWNERKDSTSLDSKHIARSIVHFCQHFGPDIMVSQFIELAKVDGSDSVKVFKNDMGGSALAHWSDSQHLAVEIGAKSAIALSLHDFDGVYITYYVPRGLMSTSFSDTQIETLHQAGKLNDANYETMKKGNQFWREWEERFFNWASENATIVQR
jgi:hypothetical protein